MLVCTGKYPLGEKMQDTNLDVNLIIQSFQEKLNQLTTDLIVKEATIKQLSMQIQQLLENEKEEFLSPEVTKKEK